MARLLSNRRNVRTLLVHRRNLRFSERVRRKAEPALNGLIVTDLTNLPARMVAPFIGSSDEIILWH